MMSVMTRCSMVLAGIATLLGCTMIHMHHTLDTQSVLVAPASYLTASGAKNADEPVSGANGICAPYFGKVTYQTDTFNQSNVDMASTAAKGYQWYPWNWGTKSGRAPAADHLSLNRDGSISVSGTSGPNGQLMSAAMTDRPPYFVGKAFGGGFCVEAQVSFDPKSLDTSKGFPSFWALPLEHMNTRAGSTHMDGHAPDYEHFTELDFMEVYRQPYPEYLGSVLEWYGQYNKTCAPNHGFCKVAKSFDNTPGVFPATTDWSQWHRVGAVWYPSEKGRPGSIQYFFDGKPLAKPYMWEKPDVDNADPKSGAPSLFSVTDKYHMMLIFGSNSTPIRVRSVIVRQHDDLHNIAN